LDPRYKALKFLSVEKICDVKTELRCKIQNLEIDIDSLNSESWSQPSLKTKALNIFGPEENDTSVRLEDELVVTHSWSTQLAKDQSERRKCFLKLLSNVHFLSRQGLAFCGDGDESDHNFMLLIQLRSEDDSRLSQWVM